MPIRRGTYFCFAAVCLIRKYFFRADALSGGLNRSLSDDSELQQILCPYTFVFRGGRIENIILKIWCT